MLTVKKLTVLNNLTCNLFLMLINKWIYSKCLKFTLKLSFKKKRLSLNLKDGLFVNFLKIEKKKLKYFS